MLYKNKPCWFFIVYWLPTCLWGKLWGNCTYV